MRALKLPTQQELLRQLKIVQKAKIPLWVVTGGWSPAFTAVGDTVASIGAGEHTIIPSPHHFPQLVSDEFDNRLEAFVKSAEA